MYVCFFLWQVSESVSEILALYLLGIGSIPKFAVSHTPSEQLRLCVRGSNSN